jgi:hypothetical protein
MRSKPSPENPRPRSRLRLGLQALAIAVVTVLLGLLAQRTAAKEGGPHLVSQIEAGKTPRAPDFDLPVLWARSETWPGDLRAALANGRIPV